MHWLDEDIILKRFMNFIKVIVVIKKKYWIQKYKWFDN